MTIFAILFPNPQPQLVEAIQQKYSKDNFTVTPTQWLVSSPETIVEVTANLGIYDAKNPDAPAHNLAVVFAISSYTGRAPTLVWDWIKSKLEASAHG